MHTSDTNLLPSSVLLLMIIAVPGLLTTACSRDQSNESTGPEFVGRDTCAGCHQQQMKAYENSHHDLAMEEATEETVRAPFDGETFSKGDVEYTFLREENEFYVKVTGPDDEPAERFEVPYTFGVTPLQQYLLDFPKGRLQALSIAWNSRENEWFSLYPDRSIGRDDWLHWTNQSQNWNSTCASCHSTNYRKNYDPEKDAYRPKWSEIDVSCEACHGPGSKHVNWAKNREDSTSQTPETDESDPSSSYGLSVNFTSGNVSFRTGPDGVPERVNPDRSVPDTQLTECGRCHGRRSRLSRKHRHGERFLDHFSPSLLEEGLYHPDGQVKEEVYVYGSFRQSRMYEKGVRCTHCHEPHSGELKLDGNQVCTQCHGADTYDTPEHHHHPPSSSGASCVNCHMTEKTFMQVDPRRDHKFHVPQPAVSDRIGAPDACTSCHEKKTSDWAARQVQNWTDDESTPSYGPMFYDAWEGDPDALSELRSFLNDAEQPDFLRASAASALTRYPTTELRDPARELFDASDPLLRRSAVQLYSAGQTEQSSPAPDPLLPLLEDPVRGVRFAAARSLSTMETSDPTEKQKDRIKDITDEIERVLLANQDSRGGLFSLGQYYMQQDRPKQAITYFRRAIEMDDRFLDARTALARLLAREEQPEEAAEVLQPATKFRQPPNMSEEIWNRAMGQLHYQLGLLHAGPLENRSRARDHLERAVRYAPDNARAHYNLGLLYSQLGKVEQADRTLQQAVELQPNNPEHLYALVTIHRDHGNMDKAVKYARTLKNRFPDNRRFQRIYRIMKRQAE